MNIKKTLSFSTTLIVLGLLFFNSTSLKTAAAEAAEQPSPGFLCKHCQKVFPDAYELRAHEDNEEQPKSEFFYCSACYYKAKSPADLRTHFRKHTGERPYACGSCTKSFTRKSHLTAHESIHSGETRYECLGCEKTFRQSSALKIHMRIHTGERPFACGLCSKQFAQKRDLTRHKFIHTGEMPFTCNLCYKTFRQQENCKRHSKSCTGPLEPAYHPLSPPLPALLPLTSPLFTAAPVAPYTVLNLDGPKMHLFSAAEMPYLCTVCQIRYKDESNLTRHMSTHNPLTPPPLPSPLTPPPPVLPLLSSSFEAEADAAATLAALASTLAPQ